MIGEERAGARCCEHMEALPHGGLVRDSRTGWSGARPRPEALACAARGGDGAGARAPRVRAGARELRARLGAEARPRAHVRGARLRRGSPPRGARRPSEGPAPDERADRARLPFSRGASPRTPRVAALVARAIRARDLAMLDVWLASLGPVTSGLLEDAVRGAIRRTPPPPPQPKKHEPKFIEGYELIKPIGEGGIGSRVWLACAARRGDPALRPQDPEGGRPSRTRPTWSARDPRASFVEEAALCSPRLPPERREHHRPRRSPARCRSWCSST